MFYLKYRPQTIADIDATGISVRLSQILSQHTLAHAFLFSGPKGTGKTSTARILAKAINCQANTYAGKKGSFEPCNVCNMCTSITRGTAPDIVEMDAASYRKIDDIRELTSSVKFAPSLARNKVYIIDEVHMLTKEAFNALLKTLEEPPSHTVFILATTEPEALPKTIISRCIQVQFLQAKPQEIVHMLARIAKAEKLKVSKEELEYIAKYADNSFRDGAKLFEELSTQNNFSKSALDAILGILPAANELFAILEKKDQEAAVAYIRNVEEHGGSFKVLTENLLQDLRQMLLKKNGIATELSQEYTFTIKQIARLMWLFQEAYRQLRYTPIESVPLSIAVVEYCSSEL